MSLAIFIENTHCEDGSVNTVLGTGSWAKPIPPVAPNLRSVGFGTFVTDGSNARGSRFPDLEQLLTSFVVVTTTNGGVWFIWCQNPTEAIHPCVRRTFCLKIEHRGCVLHGQWKFCTCGYARYVLGPTLGVPG